MKEHSGLCDRTNFQKDAFESVQITFQNSRTLKTEFLEPPLCVLSVAAASRQRGLGAESSNGSRKSFFCLRAVSEKEVGQARLLDRHALSLDGFCRSDGGVISLHSMGHHTASPFRRSCGAHTRGNGGGQDATKDTVPCKDKRKR